MFCQKCGTQNDPDALFCLNCGNQLISRSTEIRPPQFAPAPPPAAAQNTGFNANGMQQYTGQGSQAVFNVWGPFAGRGTQRSHNGWLMDNKGEQASELVTKVSSKFQDREIPGAKFERKILTAKGMVVEQRPYFLHTRRMTTVGLYIAQFGKDLFVSIASYLKPPISYLRVIIVAMMLLFSFYTLFIMPGVIENEINGMMSGLVGGLFGGGGGGGGSALASLLCITGPLGTINLLLLGLLLAFSIYKWVGEKDFLFALRTKPNEFDEDDLMAMEKAVEQTVRISMDEIGLNPDDLKPVQQSEIGRFI